MITKGSKVKILGKFNGSWWHIATVLDTYMDGKILKVWAVKSGGKKKHSFLIERNLVSEVQQTITGSWRKI